MSEGQRDLFLGQALTELERLMVVWDNLTATGGGSPFIEDLVGKSIGRMKSCYKDANLAISLDNFRRFLEMHKRIKANGNAEAADRAGVVVLFAKKVVQNLNSHLSTLESDALRKSTLELFEDLESWSVLRALAEDTFAPGNDFTDAIAKAISWNVAACPIPVVANPGSLKVVEMGAKLMRVLPHEHQSKIFQVISSHVMGLTTADDKDGSGHVHNSAQSAVVDVGDGKVGERASREPAAAKNTRGAKVTADFQTEIRRLQEQANQYQVTISEMNQDKELYTQEKLRLEGQVHDMNQKSRRMQSSDFDVQQAILVLQSEMAELKSKNAAFEKSIGLSNKNETRELKEEVATLRETFSDRNNALDTDDKIYDESFQGRAEKLAEELAEAEEDKAALARDNARLAVEKASAEESLAESQDSKIAMSNEIHGLGAENDRLGQELKDARHSLEEAEDDRAALSRNVEKLTFEKTYLEKELASARDTLRQISSFSSSIRPIATDSLSQHANANADTDTATSSTGVLTPPSSTQTTP